MLCPTKDAPVPPPHIERWGCQEASTSSLEISMRDPTKLDLAIGESKQTMLTKRALASGYLRKR